MLRKLIHAQSQTYGKDVLLKVNTKLGAAAAVHADPKRDSGVCV